MKGAVIDGFTRDLARLHLLRFPVYCRGTSVEDAYGVWQIERYKCAIQMPGRMNMVDVYDGDIIFADHDGVLAIPASHAETTLKKAQIRAANETTVRERIAAGNAPADIYKELGRW